MAINTYQTDFAITETGDVSGKEYTGVFTIKTRLSHTDRFRQDAVRRSLLGGVDPNAAGDIAQKMAEAFSQIAVRVVKAPDWWNESNGGLELPDFNVVTAIYTECIGAEEKAIAAVVAKAEAAKKDLSKPITTE